MGAPAHSAFETWASLQFMQDRSHMGDSPASLGISSASLRD